MKIEKTTLIWCLLGVISLSIFAFFYESVFPSASIRIILNKNQAIEKAESFISQQSIDLAGFDRAAKFSADKKALIYIQKSIKDSTRKKTALKKVPIWYWRVRWFKALTKEGFVVNIDPETGEIVDFLHLVSEDAKGDNITEEQAYQIAKSKLLQLSINHGNYELKKSGSEERKNRMDHFFVWQLKDFNLKDANLRIRVDINGSELGSYSRFLKVPEKFSRNLKKELSMGSVLSAVTNVLIMIFLAIVIGFIIKDYHKFPRASWKIASFFALAALAAEVVRAFNSIPLIWNGYPSSVSKLTFITISLAKALAFSAQTGFMVFAFCALGQLLASGLKGKIMPFSIDRKTVIHNVIVGYCLGFSFLAYLVLFYFISSSFLDVYMIPISPYSNILSSYLPFLYPIVLAFNAAVIEEFLYRMVGVSFLKKYLRFEWIALLLPALLWGFGHSHYLIFPMYLRGVELTIFGVIFGLVYLRYGIITVIIAHFIIDVLLSAAPLLRSPDLFFASSGFVILFVILLLPFLLVVLLKKRRLIDAQ